MMKIFFIAAMMFSALVAGAQVSDPERSLAVGLVEKNSAAIGLQQTDIDNSIVSSTYIIPGSDIRMVYLQQSYKGIPVYNKLHVLAFRKEKAVSVAGSRIDALASRVSGSDGTPGIDPVKAVKAALSQVGAGNYDQVIPEKISNGGKRFDFGNLGVSSEKVFAELLWFPVNNEQKVKLVWQVFVAPLNSSSYWLVRVDAKTGKVIDKEDMTIYCDWDKKEGAGHTQPAAVARQPQLVLKRKEQPANQWQYRNYVVNTATYRVVKYPAESPQHPGGTPVTHTDPWLMSPGNATTLGWQYDGTIYYDSLRGNNAFAYEDRDANNLPGYSALSTTAQPSLTFNFTPDFSQEPYVRTPVPNQQFNTTNLFYWNNLMHDLSYLYGFTETSKNYQNDNMGRGGTGGDYVLAEAQDGSGTNNANFSPGVEGSRGRMQMYLWPSPTPDRDGDADNGVIAHEYTHGISNRMTGSGVGCLNNVEQMGEGWSDYLCLMITHDWATATPNDGFNNPRGIGTYVLNQPTNGVGIRQYRYTTNMAVNPMTYGNLPSVAVPHGVGTIWCTALWDMTWYIIQQAGISPNLFDPTGTGGNVIALKLVIEGLRLQPCSPGFIDGRNAILKADTLFYGAQYSCAILEAFARRGMGVGASQGSASIRGDEVLSFDNGKPNVTADPQNANVCAGSNHTFSVTATGINISYRWQVSTNSGSSYSDIGGANTSSYSLTGVTPGLNGNMYRCIVSGCPLPDTSAAATLTVTSPPTLNSSPANTTVCEGTNASFSVTASGTGVLYQWQVSTDGGTTWTNIPGAVNPGLTVTAVTPAMNNNRYRCLLTNSVCTTPVNSAGAVLTVNPATAITTQPADATICQGANNNLCVTAAGVNLIYQWEASISCAGPWSNVAGAASAPCLTVSPASTFFYRVAITGTCGAVINSNCATVTVITPVIISQQPVNTEVCSGSNASFNVTASSNQAINYQWQVSTDGGTTWTNVNNTGVYSGATTATLSITGAQTAMSNNRYRCLLSTNACLNPVITSVALLTVRQLPSVNLAASPLTSLLPGQITTLTASNSASTGGVISNNWFLNNNQLSHTGTSLQVNVEQLGTYQVRVLETFASGIVCSAQSSPLVIDAKASDKLFIFPSPNDGRFTVSYYNSGGSNTRRRIVVFDAKGANVYEQQFPITGPYTLLKIDLRTANRGIYIVAVGDAAGNKLAEGKVHVQ
ncbi:MAG: M36 family metallopeptidase [Chitinophagaceae bacterium]